jgi:hypothetical protein
VDITGSRMCPVAGFGISGVESSGSVTKMLVINLKGRFTKTLSILLGVKCDLSETKCIIGTKR